LCILEVRCTGGFVIRRLVREIGIGKNYFFILAHSENGMICYNGQAFDVCMCVWLETLLSTPPRKMTCSLSDFNIMLPGCVSIQIVLEVKDRGHKMWALLCFQEYGYFSFRSSIFARYLTVFITASEVVIAYTRLSCFENNVCI